MENGGKGESVMLKKYKRQVEVNQRRQTGAGMVRLADQSWSIALVNLSLGLGESSHPH